MKINLLTIWHEMNYGAELQAYATIKMLQEMGYRVQMIDIRLSDCRKLTFKGWIANIISSIGPGKQKFDRFWHRYIPVTKRYRSMESLQSDPPDGDVYLVGSDQVWNPDLTGNFAQLYYLDFGNDRVHRVSYASSFGTHKWTADSHTEKVKVLLQRFSHVSCRELSGVEILRNTFGVDSLNVLDPTLLHDDYVELTGKIKQRDTLVCYPLSKDPELLKYAHHLADQLGLCLINNNQTTNVLRKMIWNKVGIEEWIRSIAESKFVITRSFHGLAFSIIYKKNFAIIASENNRGTRIISLLSQLGLQDRYYTNIQKCEDDEPWNHPIDYDKVYESLNKMRTVSLDYLKKALQ